MPLTDTFCYFKPASFKSEGISRAAPQPEAEAGADSVAPEAATAVAEAAPVVEATEAAADTATPAADPEKASK